MAMAPVSQKFISGTFIGVLALLCACSAHDALPNVAKEDRDTLFGGKHTHDVVAEYHRLKTAAEASGLKHEDLEKVVQALKASKLNPEQLKKLEEAILKNSPTPENLKKLIEYLAMQKKVREVDEDADENAGKSAWDWLFKPVGPPKSSSSTSK